MQTAFIKVINMSYQAGIVICFIILARFVLKLIKVPKKYAYYLWIIPFIRMVFPLSFESAISLLPKQTTSNSTRNIFQVQTLQIQPSNDVVEQSLNNTSAIVGNVANVSTMKLWITVATVIWIIGIIILVIYSIFSFAKIRKRLIGNIHYRHNIYKIDHIRTPFILGIIRPRIYIPSNIDEKESEFIVKHEMIHLRRKDHIVKLLTFGVVCIHWFNPLCWVAFILGCRDMELSVDECVVSTFNMDTRKEYAITLLSMATKKGMITGVPLAFGEGDVKERIKNIVNYKKPFIIVVVIAIIGIVILGIALLTNPLTEEIPAENVETSMKEEVNDNEIEEQQIKSITADKVGNVDFEKTLEEWENTVSTKPGENIINQDESALVSDQVILLTQDEKDDISLYGLYTKEYGYRGIYFYIGDDLNSFDISWDNETFWARTDLIQVLEEAEDGKPRIFSLLMPDEKTSSSEIWRLFIVDRYDTGTLSINEFTKADYYNQAKDLIINKVEDGKLKIESEGTVIYEEEVAEGISKDAIPILMDNFVFFEVDNRDISCHLLIGLQEGNVFSIGGRPPVSFHVNYGDFGQHTLKLEDAYIDERRQIKTINEFEHRDNQSMRDVSMSVNESSISHSGVTITLRNNSENSIEYGADYKVQKKEKNTWVDAKYIIDNWAFTEEAYKLNRGESKELVINWKWLYGKLSKGHYLIMKEIEVKNESGNYEQYSLGIEFEIE